MKAEAETSTMTTTAAAPVSYSIVSHGIENEPDFRGATATGTQYAHVATGTGETEAGAYDDAVENLVWTWGDTRLDVLGLPKFWGDDERDVCQECECNGDVAGCDVGCEVYYHVSIYFNLEA